MKAYVARDKDNMLYLHFEKPCKKFSFWFSESLDEKLTDADLPEGVNPQWSDDYPIEVELTIQKK